MTAAEAVRDLAAERPLIEAIIGRPLRQAEQAIDVLRLDQALDQAKDELEQAIRAEMVRATAAWANGDTVGVHLNVTEAMLAPLDALAALGGAEALLELERHGYTGIRLAPPRRYIADPLPPRDRNVHGWLLRNLLALAVRIENDHVQADLAGASEVVVANALLATPGARDIASRIVSTALVDGMANTWEANQDLVGGWEYTAILDGGTCDECAPLDGTQYATIEELFVVLPDFGPNPECFGGGRCRCRAVPVPA